jgi:hypothetical protein
MGSDLTQTAAELYGRTPDDFTAARNARAKAAATDGDRELADRIRHLPKPSAPAWSINALVRADPRMIADLLTLRTRFAAAQETGDRDELRALDAQRHESISAALARAESLTSEAGKRLGPQAAHDVEQTLRAAIADENAATAVQSGLLVRPLTASGFEPVDISDAVAVPLDNAQAAAASAEEAPPRRKAAAGRTAASKAARDRARRAAKLAVTAAEDRVRESDADVASAEDRLRQLSVHAKELGDEEARLRKRLAQVTEQLAGLDRDRQATERDRDRAERVAERAVLGLERARNRQESTRVAE